MSMILNNKRLINGVNPKHAKAISRFCYPNPRTIDDLTHKFETTETTMMAWLVRLQEIDVLDTEVDNGNILWLCIPYGFTHMIHARTGSPLTGTQFAELVIEVADRARAYNKENRFPYLIEDIHLFGPILNQPWRLDDPDVTISISPKPSQGKRGAWQSEYCAKYGPERSLSIFDQLMFPQKELLNFLRKGSKKIGIYIHDITELSDEWRLVFQKDATKEQNDSRVMDRSELIELGRKIDETRNKRTDQASRTSRRITKSNEDIVSFWKDNPVFRSLGLPSIEDASKSCWRCGSRQDIQRCHIIPASLGGAGTELNLVLLCSRCHAEGPNIADQDIMFDWIKAHRNGCTHDYWLEAGMKEYEFIYGKSIEDEISAVLKDIGISGIEYEQEALKLLKLLTNEASVNAIFHFGQTYFNTATTAGLFRIALKELPGHLRSAFP